MPEGSHHSSSDGTMTEEQMQELDEANGPDGQRLFLEEGMINTTKARSRWPRLRSVQVRIRMRSRLPRTSLKASKPRWTP
jgi:hypothetical protein